jgi:ComF family protein
MFSQHNIIKDFFHLFYPHICQGCGTDIISAQSVLCIRCIDNLPITNFHFHTGNQVEKIFWGRIPLNHATSLCYFNSGSLIQSLLHQLKYKGNKELGYFLGRLMGSVFIESNHFNNMDALLPLPLHPAKEKKRGYNQARVLCEGMSETMNIPVLNNNVHRVSATSTQTKKNRIERWQNIEGKFAISNKEQLENKHVLLVDDVITTGATLEACGMEILQVENVRLSIASLAYTIL